LDFLDFFLWNYRVSFGLKPRVTLDRLFEDNGRIASPASVNDASLGEPTAWFTHAM